MNYFSLHASSSPLNFLQQLQQLPCCLLPSELHLTADPQPPLFVLSPATLRPRFWGPVGSASSLGLPSGGRMGKMQRQLFLQGTRGENPPFSPAHAASTAVFSL